jgi:hypothetical protein
METKKVQQKFWTLTYGTLVKLWQAQQACDK